MMIMIKVKKIYRTSPSRVISTSADVERLLSTPEKNASYEVCGYVHRNKKPPLVEACLELKEL